jgi:tetratricopeptide (TPR) repeat protein
VRRDQGRLDAAIEHYRKAITLEPEYAEAYYNLGIALQGLRRIEDAVECYRKALALKSDYTEAHSNLGSALQEQG